MHAWLLLSRALALLLYTLHRMYLKVNRYFHVWVFDALAFECCNSAVQMKIMFLLLGLQLFYKDFFSNLLAVGQITLRS